MSIKGKLIWLLTGKSEQRKMPTSGIVQNKDGTRTVYWEIVTVDELVEDYKKFYTVYQLLKIREAMDIVEDMPVSTFNKEK